MRFCAAASARRCSTLAADAAPLRFCSTLAADAAATPAPFSFEVLHRSSKPGSSARVGRLHTPHGVVDTPGFVAVGTNASLKGVTLADADAAGMQLMFANTYHLLLQPGPALVAEAGGLHSFMSRQKPLITDSGGFQIFSLREQRGETALASGSLKRAERGVAGGGSGGVLRVDEEGVLFASYRDGARVLLTPESSARAQQLLGADIILPLDHLMPYVSAAELAEGTARSHRWMERSLRVHLEEGSGLQAMYGIVHGGTDDELRAESASLLAALHFDGFAVGGALGKDRAEMGRVLQKLLPHLPPASPVHLLGIGDLDSLRVGAQLGVDTFDSSWPTKAGRHGEMFTRHGTVKLRSAQHARENRPADETCGCPVCRQHSLAYLHHLYRAREPVLGQLAALHNLWFTLRAMEGLRAEILEDRL